MSFELGSIFLSSTSNPSDALLRSPTVIICFVGVIGCDVLVMKRWGMGGVALSLLRHPNDIKRNGGDDVEDKGQHRKSSDDIPNKSNSNLNGVDVDIHGTERDNDSKSSESLAKSRSASTISIISMDLSDKNANTEDAQTLQTKELLRTQPPLFVVLSFSLLAALYLTQFVYIHLFGGTPLGAVILFYTTTALTIAIHTNRNIIWTRSICLVLIKRLVNILKSLFKPSVDVPFADVLLADLLCSISKVFFDIGLIGVFLWYWGEEGMVERSWKGVFVPSLLAASPFIVRGWQCFNGILYERIKLHGSGSELHGGNEDSNGDDRESLLHPSPVLQNSHKSLLHALNLMKYLSSVVPILLSAAQQIHNPSTTSSLTAEGLENMLVASMVVNSVYCFIWDVMMDWGFCVWGANWVCWHDLGVSTTTRDGEAEDEEAIPEIVVRGVANKNPSGSSFLRPILLLGPSWSTFVIIANLFLRFTWILRIFSGDVDDKDALWTKDQFVLMVQFLEVARRGAWIVFRMEWECIKTTRGKLLQRKKFRKQAEKSVGMGGEIELM